MATPSFSIIQATLEQLELIVPLFDAYRQFYGRPSNRDRARSFIGKRLINGESVVFLALDAEHRAIGFTQLYPLFSSIQMKRLWILNDLFVLPEERKKGVATALLERARQFALETVSVGLTLQTAATNAEAQHVYERLGWKKDEEFLYYHLDI